MAKQQPRFPDWVTPGTDVFVVTFGVKGRILNARRVRVESVSTQRTLINGSLSAKWTQARPVNDPEVLAYLQAKEQKRRDTIAANTPTETKTITRGKDVVIFKRFASGDCTYESQGLKLTHKGHVIELNCDSIAANQARELYVLLGVLLGVRDEG